MKVYNNHKFCFIICTNDERQLQECLLYISLLIVPEGFEIEVITIDDAVSMTQGYNEAMHASDARYKVYLHQDTFIVEKNFLKKVLSVFEKDNRIGMIGMVGAEKLSKDGVMWHNTRIGDFYRLDKKMEEKSGIKRLESHFREVEAVDGFLIITCQDIPWREDIFDGWDFYDVSQCLEFRKAGYKVVVPAQNPAWAIHDCGPQTLWNYEAARQKLMQEYADFFAEKKELRILFFHSTKINIAGLPVGFMDLGHEVYTPEYKVTLERYLERDRDIVIALLEEGHYDLVVTYDFARSVSVACESKKVKYLAWVYDSPLMELYTKEAVSDYNYFCVFDRKQKERLQGLGLKNLFYYPLAAEVDNFGAVVISKTDEKKYASQVSFVGMLYDQGWFEKIFANANEEIKEDALAVANSTQCIWDGKNNVYGRAGKDTLQFMTEQEGEETWQEYCVDKDYFNEALLLTRKANEIERVTILNKLAEKYQVVLYTGSEKTENLKNVKIRPRVNYLSVMPKIFYLSKINLNITSRSIESGLPQRIWDVMGVGGFLLTNYQPELEEYFEIGKDLEVFHNLEEMMEKVDYYLKHEDKRLRIALNGYKKVREHHKYSNRVKQILEEVFDYKN